MEQKKRVPYFDLIKFVAIFLVVWAHVYMCNNNLHEASLSHKFIYSFHMPLFMIVSGFFAFNSFSLKFLEFFRSKFMRLLLPAIAWSLIGVCYKWLFEPGVSLRDEFIGNSWYLKTLFVCYLFAYICKKTYTNDILFALGSYLLLLLIPGTATMQINWMYFFFLTGYFFRKHTEAVQRHYALILPVCIALSALTFYFKVAYNLSTTPLAYSTYTPSNILPFANQFVLALSASFAVIALCYYIDKLVSGRSIYSHITEIGKQTLGIYVVQTLVVVYILPSLFKIELDGWAYNLFVTGYTVIAVEVCYYITQLLARQRYLSLILLGNPLKKR